MTSATLFREGTDLDGLLAELDEEYPGQVRVLEVNHTREGGVMGFFARPRVAVHFTVDAATSAGKSAVARPAVEPDESLTDPLDALIAAAEMVETGQAREAFAAGTVIPVEEANADNVEFARMLLNIAARKAAERGVELPAAREFAAAAETIPANQMIPANEVAPLDEVEPKAVRISKPKTARTAKKAVAAVAVETTVAIEPTAGIAPAGETSTVATAVRVEREPIARLRGTDLAGADERLTLRRRLSELGVPFARIPADAPHRYAAVEQLVHLLPNVAPLPETADQIVVVAGPVAQVTRTAELLIKQMGLLPWNVWSYRCPGVAALPDREIRDADQASSVAATARSNPRGTKSPQARSTLVVIGLVDYADGADTVDGDGPDGQTAAAIIHALEPEAFWLHVDATRKAGDTAALVRELGRPTALVVTGAARTASPASVWELDVPVAMLDGRPATASMWAVLLLDKLTETAA